MHFLWPSRTYARRPLPTEYHGILPFRQCDCVSAAEKQTARTCRAVQSGCSDSDRLEVFVARLDLGLGLLFRRRQAFEALEQLFLGHAIARDFGIVGIHAPGGTDK